MATPPNFLDPLPDVVPEITRAHQLEALRLDALGLNEDDLLARIVDLGADLHLMRELLTLALAQLQANQAHIHHLKGCLRELRGAARLPTG